MKAMRLFFSLIFFLCPLVAFGAATLHSKVEVTKNQSADGNVEFTFRIIPDPNHKATFDAPWRLKLVEHTGLTFTSPTLGKAEMNEKIPGFVAKTAAVPSEKEGTLKYEMISFVCTQDKSRCFRDVHKSEYAWKK